MEERTIYITFAKPTQEYLDFVRTAEHMIGDTDSIYFVLRRDTSERIIPIRAEVISNVPFKYFGPSGAVHEATDESPESLRSLTDKSLDTFVKLNNGVINHSMSWEQGLDAFLQLENLEKSARDANRRIIPYRFER